MIYKEFKDIQLSNLGLGCMRLPVVDGNGAVIDEIATAEMVAYAMENGVNYYDTAWGYHGGNSETVMGKLLKSYPRESFYIATKFPGYDLSNISKAEEIFEEQLNKLQMDYFDFYLFHNVCEKNIDAFLNPEYGISEYLMKQKKNGRIKYLGFSAHGSFNVMRRFLDAYGKDIDFGQIQLNWLDYSFQSAKEKAELLTEYQIPIWVMEPLRGGKLAKLDDAYEKQLKALRPDANIPSWAFRFLQTIPNMTMILSGMSNMEQLKDNIKTFIDEKPLDENEMQTLLSIADDMTKKIVLPCTTCNYCTAHCPKELPIPEIIELYNEHVFSEDGFIAPMAFESYKKEQLPNACIGCKHCEQVCPQQIKISEMMTDFSEKLGI